MLVVRHALCTADKPAERLELTIGFGYYRGKRVGFAASGANRGAVAIPGRVPPTRCPTLHPVGVFIRINQDPNDTLAARERQEAHGVKRLTRKQRKQIAFDAQRFQAMRDGKVLITHCYPGPKYSKKQRRRDVHMALESAEEKIKALERHIAQTATREKHEFYDSPAWQRARYEALRRSNGACELCGATKQSGAIIQVDHIKPRSRYPALELDLGNLQVLCRPCNMGKSNRDTIDWRKPELKVVRGQA